LFVTDTHHKAQELADDLKCDQYIETWSSSAHNFDQLDLAAILRKYQKKTKKLYWPFDFLIT
jgi:hypothetical protein